MFFVALSITVLSCGYIPEETRVLSVADTDAVMVVDVPNARCSKCQNIIEGGLAEEAGVKESILNLHTRQVSIAYAPGQTTPEELEKIVADLIPTLPCK